jgi:hypothetical protein
MQLEEREVGEDVVGAEVLNSQIEVSERIPHAYGLNCLSGN